MKSIYCIVFSHLENVELKHKRANQQQGEKNIVFSRATVIIHIRDYVWSFTYSR